jgi:carbon monoxide dehydrogenase subunit G
MAHITGQIRIGRPPENVFDIVADSRNEPSYNPSMIGVELLTRPPIGQGTQFRARMGRSGMDMLVELTEFDRPLRLASRTTSALMNTHGAITFTADRGGTVMSWDWKVRPRGWLRLLGPLLGPIGGRMERQTWSGLKRHLESGDKPHEP